MNLYTTKQLKLIKKQHPASIYNRIKRVNSFLDKDYSRYLQAISLYSQGANTWEYSISLEDIVFFSKTQDYILNSL